MSKRACAKADAIKAAIDRLAALFEFGALQADTDPAAFLQRVADEIETLRRASPGGDREGSAK